MKATKEVLEAIAAASQDGRVTVGPAARIADEPPLSEDEFLRRVLLLAKARGWRTFHARPGRTAKGWRTPVSGDGKGFPDLLLVRGLDLYFVELKSDKGKLTPEQEKWITALALTSAVVLVWRPSDLPAIEKLLL